MNAQMAVFILGIVSQLIGLVQKAKANAAQSKEWTAEEEAVIDRKIEEVTSGLRSWWKKVPDPS